MDLTELNVVGKETETAALQARVNDAEARDKRLNDQLLELTDAYEQKLKDRRTAFLKLHESKYTGFDIRGAIIGLPMRWSFTLMDQIFFFEVPKGNTMAEVAKFLQNPVTTFPKTHQRDEVTIDFSPIMEHEPILLRMMTGIQRPGTPEISFKGKDPGHRLAAFRDFPETLLNVLAKQAMTFDNYANLYLESQLGN
jgi:hypothetical protein